MFNNRTHSDLFANPYLVNNKQNDIDLTSIYQKLDALKTQKQMINNSITPNTQMQNDESMAKRKTVYTDIQKVWAELSTDEKNYIESSEEYVQANIEYQTAFNQFLLERMGEEFLVSKYGMAPEKVLAVINKKKDEYKNNLSNDISTIKSQNQYLMQKNEELSKNNEEMAQLIKSLQDQLWVNK